MKPRLKPIEDQTIVMTGASSGIGMETALRAAEKGARVFLISRNERALSQVCAEIRAGGGEADYFVADVADEEAMEAAADACTERFGGFDTWVNGAGVGVYEHLTETSAADHRRLFETNYFGVVNGSVTAMRRLRETEGGSIVNIGSILSDMSVPAMGAYSASKHAVKGFTNSLRMEAMEDPVSITLIKPSSIDTPFAEHAKNTALEHAARVPPPVYEPEKVAQAILAAAASRHREITVGGGGAIMSLAANYLPRISDRFYAKTLERLMQSRSRPRGETDSLYEPGADGETRGDHKKVLPVSPYTDYQITKAGQIAGTLIGLGLTALAIRRYALHARDLARWARNDRYPMKKTKRAFFG